MAVEVKDIREAFREYRNAWQQTRDDAMADMRAISVEGPWTDEDRDFRRQAGRPCIHLDQINQYLNQTIGNVRKSKRSVKLTPLGEGANDKDAKRRSNLIMSIEDRSQAQSIYLYAFECMIQRSYGYALLRTEYESPDSFDQYLCIKPVMNPDSVLITPHYKQPDVSDITDGFILDRISKRQFKEEFPKAKVTDFGSEVMGEVGIADWITDQYVQKGEFWKIESEYTKLLLVDSPEGPQIMTPAVHEKFGEKKGKVLRSRDVEVTKVMQYMTNGVEILGDAIEWAGSRIPIIACFGPERWTTEGTGNARRELLSMVRFARDPQMLFDYLATQETELAGMVPKVPYVGYKGQFESDKETWTELSKVPHAFVEADVVIDAASGQLLPLPHRESFDAPFQEYEVAKDAAARALQASMGITPLPTAAQRRNEKSGVALERIDDMEALGSFHFVDRYENCFLHNMGWQINEMIGPIYDTQRQMPMAEPDGTVSLVQTVGSTSHPLDEQGAYDVQGLEEGHMHTGKGEFDVTISTGPSHESEREEQGEFVDQLIDNIANLPQPGTPAAKVLALGIRMRPLLGGIGGQIADVFDPPNDMPPQAQAAIQQLQSQLQELTQENTALHMERAGKVVEQQTKLTIEQMRQEGENQRNQLVNDIKVLLAEISTKAQDEAERMQMYKEFWIENHGAAHEVALQAHQQAHDAQMADQAHQQAMQLADQQGQQALQQQAQSQADQT